MSVDPSGPARVEKNQSERSVVAQVRPEDGGADPVGAAVPVLEVDDIVLDEAVPKSPCPLNAKDADLVTAQPLCQRREGRGRQRPIRTWPSSTDPASPSWICRHSASPSKGPISVDAEIRTTILRGSRHRECARRLRHVDVANNRAALRLADVTVASAVVERLPWQAGDRRCTGKSQAQAQAVALRSRELVGP